MTATGHVVLLGDSIFDNAAYVARGAEVICQLDRAWSESCRATLLAVDGATLGSVASQLTRLPSDATFLVVSAGGNDALGEAHVLERRANSVSEAVLQLADAQDRFADSYAAMLEGVRATGIPTALCTIYDCNFPPPQDRVVKAALCLFNDVISRAAFAHGLPLIDLRLVCSEAADYANPIEPSAKGGKKIAAAIVRCTQAQSGGSESSCVTS